MRKTLASSISRKLPWIKVFLDYTDAVCAALPADGIEIRPQDPAGGFVFSVAEQAMHIADERWELVKWLTGVDHSDQVFVVKYPGKVGAWEFQPAGRDEILLSLYDGRVLVDDLLDQLSADQWNETTAELARAHAARVAKALAEGMDIAEFEAKGPSTLGNIILFSIAHETGHRTVLQHMLRMHGIEVVRYA